MSTANAVMAMKLEHLTGVHLRQKFIWGPWHWRGKDLKRTNKHNSAGF